MDLFELRNSQLKDLRTYLLKNLSIINQEYNIKISDNIATMSQDQFVAWLKVYSSKILLNKDAKNCKDLKEKVAEFLSIETEVEIKDNELTMSKTLF